MVSSIVNKSTVSFKFYYIIGRSQTIGINTNVVNIGNHGPF